MSIENDAIEYIKEITKSKELFDRFVSDKKYISYETPTTFFMAGSPGAGKTETSIQFIKNLNKDNFSIVRIDADEIRVLCPEYDGQNAHLFQRAAALGVNKLYDYVNKKKFNVLVDGTFSSEKYAITNIETAIKKNREVYILYIFQDPARAWEFTVKREKLQNRKITKEVFVEAFLNARNNVNKVKEKFGDKINLILIKKDYHNNDEKFWLNKENIDNYIKFDYTKEELYKIIDSAKI